VLVVGSGIAGLTAALTAAERSDVLLVTKGELAEGATCRAQGGIAGAVGPGDSPAAHARDTLAAGAGLGDAEAVRVLCTQGPAAIAELLARGVVFDRAEDGSCALGLEGAHDRPRILHAGGDATGRAIEDALIRAARARAAAGARGGAGGARAARWCAPRGPRPTPPAPGRGRAPPSPPPAVRGSSPPTPRPPPGPPGTGSPRPGGPAPRSRTSSSSSSIPPRSPWRDRTPRSSSPRRCGARGRCCAMRRGGASCPRSTPAASSPRETSSPARSPTSWPHRAA